MSGSSRYSPELRERAVRMVNHNRQGYRSEWAGVSAISKLFGMSPGTLRTWVRKAQLDVGARLGRMLFRKTLRLSLRPSSRVKPGSSSLHRHPEESVGVGRSVKHCSLLLRRITRLRHGRCVNEGNVMRCSSLRSCECTSPTVRVFIDAHA